MKNLNISGQTSLISKLWFWLSFMIDSLSAIFPLSKSEYAPIQNIIKRIMKWMPIAKDSIQSIPELTIYPIFFSIHHNITLCITETSPIENISINLDKRNKTTKATIMKRQVLRKRFSYISFFLFPVTFVYFSPYVIIDAGLKGIICGSFFMFILLFIGSLFLGRAFCSWACALGGAQEMLSPLKTKFAKKGRHMKWVIWLPWILAIVIVAFRAGGYQKIDPFFRTTHGFSLGNIYTLIAYLAVLFLVLISYFAVGKRSFCRHLCWIAPFMILGRKIQSLLKTPSLKLVTTENACVNCHRCTKNCLMGLDVEEMIRNQKMENSECILCGSCADVCSKDCIELKFTSSVLNKNP